MVKASALTGEGIAELRGEILRDIGGEAGPGFSPTFASRDW
jgi:hypothetical protein